MSFVTQCHQGSVLNVINLSPSYTGQRSCSIANGLLALDNNKHYSCFQITYGTVLF